MKTTFKALTLSIFSLSGLLCIPQNTRAGGTVVAWGASSQTNACSTNVVAIATGYEQTLLLRSDGTVANCGTHFSGIPITVPPALSNVIAVAGGWSHSLALKSDGTVIAWGRNTYGQINVPAILTNVIAIAAGDNHSLALRADGTVVSWGNFRTNVPADLTNVVALAAGNADMALLADGTVRSFGFNSAVSNSTSGLSNIVAISAPVAIIPEEWYALRADGTLLRPAGGYSLPPGLTNIVVLAGSSGTDHHMNLAVKADGTVVGWGYNFYAFYDGVPMVPAGLSNIVAVSSDSSHSIALVGDGPPTLDVPAANPAWDSNHFTVSVPTQSGRVYRLEYKNSLDETNWTTLPLVAGNGGTRTLVDPSAGGPQRFYRVRRW
jgi:alpha-tubulin suppressor-like RCC1 family protein